MANTILSVRDLRVNFSLRGKTLTAVRGASLDLYENETLAIVGESGSGKSVLTTTLIGMTDKNGTIVPMAVAKSALGFVAAFLAALLLITYIPGLSTALLA